MIRVITHASELLTGAGIRAKSGRKVVDGDLGAIPDGALAYEARKLRGIEVPGKIAWVGATRDLPKKYLKATRKNLKGERALIPGLVDCHTHLVFAGDRSDEFAARCGGASYEEIAARGGGIVSTMRATRVASAAELEKLAVARLEESMSYGVRSLEIKSGYGLSHESELKVLEVVARLKRRFPQLHLSATYLGAHAFPPDQSREAYLAEMTGKTLPEVARRKLADACDVFVDKGYFTLDEGRKLLTAAKALGLQTRVHADELANTESSAMAAEIGALSADHLLQISDRGIEALARSKTVAVLLPGTAFYLKAAHAPARKLLQAGAAVALSTDFNPGTCMTLSLPSIMTIAALYLGMTRAEIFAAVTYNGAQALGIHERRGTLETGREAAFAVLPFARFEEMYYRFAWAGRTTDR